MRNRFFLIIPTFMLFLLALSTGCTENHPIIKNIEDQTNMKDILVVEKLK